MPGYRIEVSPNNRAGCKNTECKKNNIKLLKGELRFGTFVEIQEHQSWQYKHWGCVTPLVIENIKKLIEGDLELLDGYDELPEEHQKRVKRALDQGHVDDEDWRGDVELNRPGKKGFRVKTPKKKAANDAGEDEDSPTKTKKRKPKKEAEESDNEVVPEKKQRGRPKKEPADKDEEAKAPPKKRAKKVEDEEQERETTVPAPKKPRAKKVKDEVAEEEAASPAAKKKIPVKQEHGEAEKPTLKKVKAKTAKSGDVANDEPPQKKAPRSQPATTPVTDGVDEADQDATPVPQKGKTKGIKTKGKSKKGKVE